MAVPQQRPATSRQDYATPPVFIEAVKRRFNIVQFSHDFAADGTNTKAKTYFDEKLDALSFTPSQWAIRCTDGWGWLNPPYSDIGPWASKCYEASRFGGKLLLLVPASVGANWFKQFIHKKAQVLALNGRLAFIPDKPQWLYPKDCMLCVFGPQVAPEFDVWTWRQ